MEMNNKRFVSLTSMIKKAVRDGRLTTTHMSVYLALIVCWLEQGSSGRFTITRANVMELAKIAAISTYHRAVKDLVAFGYIIYEPTYDSYTGTKITLKHYCCP